MPVSTGSLGGESKSRGIYTGRGSRGVAIAWCLLGAFGIVLYYTFFIWGLLTFVLLAVVLRVATINSGEHTIAKSLGDRYRLSYMRRNGYVDFVPLRLRPANVTRKDKRYAAYRRFPDGMQELDWLEERPGKAAVAHHYPPESEPYISAAFAVDGPVVGMAGDLNTEIAQDGFEELMSGWGSRQKLVSAIQITTHMLPPDTAKHEAWVQDKLDPAAPRKLVQEYGELLVKMTQKAPAQRHYVTVRWNKDARFDRIAATHSQGRQGWLKLVELELESAHQRLTEAGYRKVSALSGPQISAVVRHMQDPDLPIDRASDAFTDNMFLPSRMEASYVEIGRWRHRTAQIPVAALEVKDRDGMWMVPMLTGMKSSLVRTLSVHIHFVPAAEAKRQARSDASGDKAELRGAERKGRMPSDETELSLQTAQTRLTDIRSGSGYHGTLWAGFITISVPLTEDLAQASAQMEEAASAASIERLDWLDTEQAAAQSLTWPLARAQSPAPRTRSAKALDWITATAAPK